MLLKEKRDGKGLSQQYVAEYLGITQQSYSLIENGHRRLSLDKAKKLAEIFGCTIDELVYSKK